MSIFRRFFIRKTSNEVFSRSNIAARAKDTDTFETKFKVYIESTFSTACLMLAVVTLIISVLIAFFDESFHIAALGGLLGGISFLLFLFCRFWYYEVDENGVTDKLGVIRLKTRPWSDVVKITSYKNPEDKTVSLYFYGRNRILFDCSSVMIGYNAMRKMAKHKGFTIIKEQKHRWLDWIRCKHDQ